jgi:hypothetical protein
MISLNYSNIRKIKLFSQNITDKSLENLLLSLNKHTL